MNNQSKATAAYLSHYHAALAAMEAIKDALHDMPCPESVDWGNVGDMGRIAADLEEIREYLKP